MPEPIYDKSSKWLVEHQGKALAIVGGLTDVVSCQAVQADVVQPRQLPDGLLEVRLRSRAEPSLLLVEFCTYPEGRVPEQLMDDVMLVRQARKVLPDVLAIVLCPKGQMKVPEEYQERSELGFTRSAFGWKVVELWKLEAETMLACPDVGVVPLVPLMHFTGPAEPLLRRCRERIDKEGGAERDSLLAVSKVLAGVKFADKGLLDLFLRSEAMIESPVIKEIVEEVQAARTRQGIEEVLKARLGQLSDDGRARLRGLADDEKLMALLRFASVSPTLEAFVERLNRETTPAEKVSSRRKRKS
jgi:predicted transposase YdaD